MGYTWSTRGEILILLTGIFMNPQNTADDDCERFTIKPSDERCECECDDYLNDRVQV